MNEYFEGKLHITKEGYGFVILEEDELKELGDIFIPKRYIKKALEDDTVLVRVFKSKRGKSLEGRLLKILKRGTLYVYGVVKKINRNKYSLVCATSEFYLEKSKKNREYINCKVKARIIDYNDKIVRIIKNYGAAGDIETAEKIIYDEYEVPAGFNKKVRKQLHQFPDKISEEEQSGRADFTSEKVLTIDPEDAKDFDDAISLSETEDEYILKVHIADVSHYVRKNTAIDNEAYNRGTSIYLPGKVIPMLPEKLSNNLCSLKPGEKRLTLTVQINIDKNNFKIKKTIFYESIIKSFKRFTYEEVDGILNSKDKSKTGYSKILKKMNFLARNIRRKRFEKGSLDLDLPEIRLKLDKNNKVIDYQIEYTTPAHQLVEEFMLMANKAVAEYLTKKKVPLMYRVHEEPFEEKLQDFYRFLNLSGIRIKESGKIKIHHLQKIIKSTADHPDNKIIIYNLLRSLKQAKYSSVNYGHFGLGFKEYTHFTSPIRRYPDLFIHRLLKKIIRKGYIKQEEKDKINAVIEEQAQHCSVMERKAEECERELKKIKLLEYLSDKTDRIYPAVVSGIINSGLFAELEMGIETFLPFSQFKTYIYDEKLKVLFSKQKNKTIKIGTKLKVHIHSIDMENRKVVASVILKNF